MDKKFDFDVTEAVIKKVQEDSTGQLAAIVNDIIFNAKKAADSGFSMAEIASVTTLGVFVSQEPELQTLVNFLLDQTKPLFMHVKPLFNFHF